ncbi:MAG: flagellar brake protein [Gammaproteobacteria bacterium]|jgi:c-di-GMP-binding flagellar brake protein YcgR
MAFSLKQIFPFFNPGSEQISEVDFRNSVKIQELFNIMQQERTIISIRFPETEKDYTSCIVQLDDDGTRFTLDEILPEEGNKIFREKRSIIASSSVHGAQISFSSQLISDKPSQQFHSYWCSIPDSISFVQRRGDYRLLVPNVHRYEVTAEHEPSHQLLKGYVVDISALGIGIAFKASHIVKPGDRLIHCQMAMSDTQKIKFTVGVCHIESTSPDTIVVGGSIMDINSESRDLLNRLTRQLERNATRN